MIWAELTEAPLEAVLAWASEQPWCRAMAECRQDAGWHAEGDVWTHTQMVCAELERLHERASLTARERTILFFAAVFHDAGKPLTSYVDPETGNVRSPRHAAKGEYLARTVLRTLGCDLAVREEIARLVRFHGRPPFLFEKPDPAREVISMSWLVNNKLLYLLALADTRGRRTAEGRRAEENLDCWKLCAEEHGCFDAPYPFANDHARFLFYRDPRHSVHYAPHEAYRCSVTLMSGLPGSGKDAWLAAKRAELPVVSLDGLRNEFGIDAAANQGHVVQMARERSREHLRAYRSFAFSATNLVCETRRRWIDLFADYGARIEIVYIEPRFEIILAQNRRRPHPVPEQVIHELAKKCEPPTWTEAHHLALSEGT